jgi:ammonium transporter
MKRWLLSLTALVLLSLLAIPARAVDVDPKKALTTDEKIEAAQKKATDDATATGKARGDTAWMLVSTGLVLFMVPGLALFYGGMARRKNVLGTMMHSMVCLGLIGLQWFLFGYSLAFGASRGGWFGWSPDFLGLNGVLTTDTFPGTNIPIYLHCMYQGMFAIITPALISGAIAERIRFAPYCLFILLWATVVYDPLAHWVWSVKEVQVVKSVPVMKDGKEVMVDGKPQMEEKPVFEDGKPKMEVKPAGVLGAMGALDFAGGTVVHIAAGFSALAAILVLRKRRGYPEHAMHPNSMVLTLTGAGILWFGWFGFNGGSALASSPLAVSALGASQVAAAATALTWMLIEWIHKGKPTALGVATGLVGGLVAVTPASGFVTPLGGLAIGIATAFVCYGAVALKPFLRYDDSLDAFGVHGVGGFLGAILTGVFASVLIFNGGSGNKLSDDVGKLKLNVPEDIGKLTLDDDALKNDKNKLNTVKNAPTDNRGDQIRIQTIAAVGSAAYSFIVSLVLVFLIDTLVGFGLTAKEENEGLDRAAHGEVGFDMSPALEMVPETPPHEPRAAQVPPNGKKHFTVVVEGVDQGTLRDAWSKMCGAGTTPPPEFRDVYPYVTTVKGNRFHFRGGDPTSMRDSMRKVFESQVGGAVKARVEE